MVVGLGSSRRSVSSSGSGTGGSVANGSRLVVAAAAVVVVAVIALVVLADAVGYAKFYLCTKNVNKTAIVISGLWQ